jgi:hypothetical protein
MHTHRLFLGRNTLDAKARSVREILQSGNQFLIPYFQRGYSWRKQNWQRVWSDLLDLVSDDTQRKHFLGPLVCTLEKAPYGDIPIYLLIDGQQRITTLTLLIAALRDLAITKSDQKLADKIHETYLVHRHEEGLQRYKVLPRLGDRDALISIIEGKTKKTDPPSELLAAHRFFVRCITEFVDQSTDPDVLPRLLGKVVDGFAMVVITITDENPFEIFESLNSTGQALEESDLIRNFIFMQIPLHRQESFNAEHWMTFEKLFFDSEGEASREMTNFYRQFQMRNGVYSKAKRTFVDFKESFQKRQLAPETMVTELTSFAALHRLIVNPEADSDSPIHKSLCEIDRLDVTTATPLLLNLLDRHARAELETEELLACLKDLQSFVLRRSLCGESTRGYGRWFVEAINGMDSDPRRELQTYWFKRGWPDDGAVMRNLQSFEIYRREPKKTRLILETLERSYAHKEKVDFSNLQIEHVMPQSIANDEDGQQWQRMLGDDWETTHQTHLHVLGNLTLTGYNPELSNKSFQSKQKELAKSNLEINKRIALNKHWNASTISARCEELFEKLTYLWPRPAGGPAYVPSSDSSMAVNDILAEYWVAFSTRFAEAFPDVSVDCPCKPAYKRSKGPRQGFWYMFFIDPADRLISVGIETSGQRRQKWIALLWDSVSWEEQEAVEKESGANCYWHSDWPQMYLLRDDVDVTNQADWPSQHEWMCQTFLRLRNVVEDKIGNLSLADFRPEALDEIDLSYSNEDDDASDAAPTQLHDASASYCDETIE